MTLCNEPSICGVNGLSRFPAWDTGVAPADQWLDLASGSPVYGDTFHVAEIAAALSWQGESDRRRRIRQAEPIRTQAGEKRPWWSLKHLNHRN